MSDEDIIRVWRQLTSGSDPEWVALSLEFRLYVLRNPEVRERFLTRYRSYRDQIESYLSETLTHLDRELVIPVGDLAAIVDWGAGGIMELGLIDPSQAHVLASFLDVLNHGAFEADPRAPRPDAEKRT